MKCSSLCPYLIAGSYVFPFINIKINATLLFNFSYQVVESMRLGLEPKLAAQDAIARIARRFPNFVGAVVALNKKGEHAGAGHGWTFKYSVRSPVMKDVEVFTVLP